jgi:hypothetical protein
MSFHFLGPRLAGIAREVGVEVGAEAAGGTSALEWFGSVKNSQAGEVLGQTFLGVVPGLADIDVVGVAAQLDGVHTVGATAGDGADGGDEIEAKFKIITVAAHVVAKHVVAVEALGNDAVGWLIHIINDHSPAPALGGAQEGAEFGLPLGIGFIFANDISWVRHGLGKCNATGMRLPMTVLYNNLRDYPLTTCNLCSRAVSNLNSFSSITSGQAPE